MQFAIEFEVQLSDGETLAAALNGILLEKPTWKVQHIHTAVANTSKIAGNQKLVMLATVVIESPKEDMLPVDKDFISHEPVPGLKKA